MKRYAFLIAIFSIAIAMALFIPGQAFAAVPSSYDGGEVSDVQSIPVPITIPMEIPTVIMDKLGGLWGISPKSHVTVYCIVVNGADGPDYTNATEKGLISDHSDRVLIKAEYICVRDKQDLLPGSARKFSIKPIIG